MNRIIILLSLLVSFLHAQQNVMSVSAENNPPSTPERELALTFSITNEIQPGFYLILPSGIRLVPITVTLNQSPMWLQNAESASGMDSVVTWNFSENRLVFLFNSDQLSSGDQVVVRTMTALNRKQLSAESAINIIPVNSDQVLQTVILPAALLGEQ